jgi:hypothetical protein
MQKDTFNADFYVTAATVIPVLFLALTLQGQTYESMTTRALAIRKKANRQKARRWYGVDLVWVAATVIILYFAAFGELLAIWSLYNRSSIFGSIIGAFWVVLTIVVVTAPAWRFWERVIDFRREYILRTERASKRSRETGTK